MSGGSLLNVGTMSGGQLLDGGTMSGGSLLNGVTMSGGQLLDGGTMSGGKLLDGGTMSGGQLLDGGILRNVKIGNFGSPDSGFLHPFMKILGGTIGSANEKAMFDFVIFRKHFACPAYYREEEIILTNANKGTYIQYVKDYLLWNEFQIASRISTGTPFRYFKDVKEGDADFASATKNTSVWNIEANNCFYEDGAMLSGIPAETRAKIRPIAEMGLPPAPIYKSNTKTFTADVAKPAVPQDTNYHIVPFAPFSFYNLKKGRYKIEALIMCNPNLDDEHFRMYFSTNSTLDENADTRVIFPKGQGIESVYGETTYIGGTFSRDESWEHTFSDGGTYSASRINTEIEVPTDGLNLLSAFRYNQHYGGELIIGDARNYFRLIKLPSYEETTVWDAPSA